MPFIEIASADVLEGLTSNGNLEVVVGRAVVRVSDQFQSDTLRRVLEVLEERR